MRILFLSTVILACCISSRAQATTETVSDSSKTSKHLKYYFIAGFNVGYDLSSPVGYVLLEPHISAGFKIKNASLGFWLSYLNGTLTQKDKLETLHMLPLGLNILYRFGHKKFIPTISTTVAYPINFTSSVDLGQYQVAFSTFFQDKATLKSYVYLRFAPGVLFNFKKGPSLNLGLNYTFICMRLVQTSYFDVHSAVPVPSHSAQFNIHSVGLAASLVF